MKAKKPKRRLTDKDRMDLLEACQVSRFSGGVCVQERCEPWFQGEGATLREATDELVRVIERSSNRKWR